MATLDQMEDAYTKRIAELEAGIHEENRISIEANLKRDHEEALLRDRVKELSADLVKVKVKANFDSKANLALKKRIVDLEAQAMDKAMEAAAWKNSNDTEAKECDELRKRIVELKAYARMNVETTEALPTTPPSDSRPPSPPRTPPPPVSRE